MDKFGNALVIYFGENSNINDAPLKQEENHKTVI